jgi:DNA polymerase III epsilon subunit-like protein
MPPIAVIDVETTGLNPYRCDRIVELAALLIRSDGTVLREFVSLINPERDIGPTRLHGLITRDVLGAPRFCEVAGSLLQVLDGCAALAGNARKSVESLDSRVTHSMTPFSV